MTAETTQEVRSCRNGCDDKPWEVGHSPNSFPASLHGYCFACAFWLDHAANPNAGTVVIEGRAPHLGRERLEFDPAKPIAGPHYGMRGFSGAMWRIRFRDGREAETDNLWLQGTIPDRFLGLFPVNADLELLK